MSARMKLVLSALGAGLAWLYVPPIGERVELPHLEPFLEPGVAHGDPVFIHTGEHVYYRVALHRPVTPWFSSTYYRSLWRRGVQFHAHTTSPHLPFQRRTGWTVSMAREKEVNPYTIEYWKGEDSSGASPVFMRWPWLYLRLGSSVLKPPEPVVVAPTQDSAQISEAVPRYPGSIVVRAAREQWRIHLDCWAEASRAEILEYYGRLTARQSAPDTAATADLLQFDLQPPMRTELLGAKSVQVSVHNMLHWIDIAIYPFDAPPGYGPEHMQQPATLTHLPRISRFAISLFYESEGAAERAFRELVRNRTAR